VSSRRIASNFAFLSTAELVCRATSVIVTLSLARRLGVVGYGRIEFAFNVVFWLVLLVRDSSDVIVARELSRHPQLIKPLVDHVLALKGVFSLILFAGLALVGTFTLRDSSDRWILTLYGLMLFTTAIASISCTEAPAARAADRFALPSNLRLCRRRPGLGRRLAADCLGTCLAGSRRGQWDRAGVAALSEQV